MAISDNQRDDNADTRQKNQPDSVISNGVLYYTETILRALNSLPVIWKTSFRRIVIWKAIRLKRLAGHSLGSPKEALHI